MLKINYMTEAKGAIDELNCHLGKAIAMAKIDLSEIVEELIELQRNNFLVSDSLNNETKINSKSISFLENKVKKYKEIVGKFDGFILQGGSLLSAEIHIARAVNRRLFRQVTYCSATGIDVDSIIFDYLNKLSGYLFTLSKYINHRLGIEEIKVYEDQK